MCSYECCEASAVGGARGRAFVGVHYQTAWRWWRDGKLPVPARQTATGTIVVEVPAAGSVAARAVVYARVSWHDQRAGVGRQVARVTVWVTRQGLGVAEVVCEAGSGLDGKRPRLRRVLPDPSATVIVVEHRDRLARFGVEHLGAALAARAGGCWSPAQARPPMTWCGT